jgi:hypothetical protein
MRVVLRTAGLALAALLAATGAWAESGGNGGPVVAVSRVASETVLLFGGRGGWLIDRKFLIGGAGYGMANTDLFIGAEGENGGERPHLTLAYGGLHLELTPRSERKWRYSVHTLLGAGSLGLDGAGAVGSDTFVVIEPGADLVLDASRNVRLGLGVSYRIATGVTLSGLGNGDVSGPSLAFSVRFGNF